MHIKWFLIPKLDTIICVHRQVTMATNKPGRRKCIGEYEEEEEEKEKKKYAERAKK